MTRSTLIAYFEIQLMTYKNLKGKDAKTLIESALNIGLYDFWHAYRWALKENDTTLTTVAGTETVDLPDDFDGLLSVIQKTSSHGAKLMELAAEKYDRLIPYSGSHDNDTPEYYKVYYNSETSTWKLALYPTPNAAISLYVKYHAVPSDIPDKYMAAIVPAIWKYIHVPGTKEYWSAMGDYERALKQLRMSDAPDVSSIDEFHDRSTLYEPHVQQWYEDP